MTFHLIINPASAGGKTKARIPEILELANRFIGENHYQYSLSEARGHSEELARRAMKNGAQNLIVVGGDGTLNEVVNGLFQAGKPIREKPGIGIIPSGSGGDFRRTLKLSNSFEEAFQRISSNQNRTPLDLCVVTTSEDRRRYFANISSVGLSAQIGVNTNQSKVLKKINGTLAFNWNIVTTTLRHQRYPLSIRSSSHSEPMKWQANCIAICNGEYFGAGVRVARDANISNGLLEIVVVHDYNPIGFLKGVNEIKKHDGKPVENMTSFQAEWIEIECDDHEREVLIETDGEFAGKLPARFEILPAAAQLL